MENVTAIKKKVAVKTGIKIPVMVFWGFFMVFSIILQGMLQATGLVGNDFTSEPVSIESASVLFAILALIFSLSFSFSRKDWLTRRGNEVSPIFLLMAVVVAISSLVPQGEGKPVTVFSDLVHSFAFSGLCGILASGLILSTAKIIKSGITFRSSSLAFIHFGALVFLSGTAVTSVFSHNGRFDLREGEKTSGYYYQYRKENTVTMAALPTEISLRDFIVEYYPSDVILGVYHPEKENVITDLLIRDETDVVVNEQNKVRIKILQRGPELGKDSLGNKTAGVKLNLYFGSDSITGFLMIPGDVIPVGNNRLLAASNEEPQPKSFTSVITAEGKSETLKVNHPFKSGDYKIYQADFRRDDPTFSGFSVTYDPGRKVVKAGLTLMVLAAASLLVEMIRRKK